MVDYFSFFYFQFQNSVKCSETSGEDGPTNDLTIAEQNDFVTEETPKITSSRSPKKTKNRDDSDDPDFKVGVQVNGKRKRGRPRKSASTSPKNSPKKGSKRKRESYSPTVKALKKRRILRSINDGNSEPPDPNEEKEENHSLRSQSAEATPDFKEN